MCCQRQSHGGSAWFGLVVALPHHTFLPRGSLNALPLPLHLRFEISVCLSKYTSLSFLTLSSHIQATGTRRHTGSAIACGHPTPLGNASLQSKSRSTLSAVTFAKMQTPTGRSVAAILANTRVCLHVYSQRCLLACACDGQVEVRLMCRKSMGRDQVHMSLEEDTKCRVCHTSAERDRGRDRQRQTRCGTKRRTGTGTETER